MTFESPPPRVVDHDRTTVPAAVPPSRKLAPVLVQVMAAAAFMALLCLGVLLAPSGNVTGAEPRAVLGNKELVRITGPTGNTVEALARIDTGAASSSIDETIAEDLEFDLENADSVTISSSLGEEERPVVAAALQLAGDSFATRVNIADRSERSTPVLLGREDLRRFEIRAGEELLTTPGEPKAPSALGALLAKSSALGPSSLLAVLPLAALVIVILRVIFGIQTLGTFSPVLLAIGYSQAGLLPGVMLTVGMFVLGFAAQPLLRRFHLPRVVRLTALVGVVAVALVTLQEVAGVSGAVDSWGASLPVVVTAVIVERLWETWEMDGLVTAVTDAVVTLAVAALVAFIILAPVVRMLADSVPIQLAVACTIWACVLGTYRGLRVSELVRFRQPSPRVDDLPQTQPIKVVGA